MNINAHRYIKMGVIMKINRFKKAIMLCGAVIAIAPVATVTAVNSNLNTQTVQASRYPRKNLKGYFVLTKMVKPKSYSFISNGVTVYQAGDVINLRDMQETAKNRYEDTYDNIAFHFVIYLNKKNSKYFRSRKKAYAYAKKHFPETNTSIPDEKLTKTQLKRRRAYQRELDRENGISPKERKRINEELEHGMDPDWYDKSNSFERKLHDETKDIDGIENDSDLD